MKLNRKHLFIPDSQVTPDTPIEHLGWIGQYIVDKKPDVIVHAGDFADMESLSSYDRGKKQHEGRRYINDIEASKKGMDALMRPIKMFNKKKRNNKKKLYKPELYLTLGNHENRINVAVECDARLDGAISVKDLCYEKYGWHVVPYQEILTIDGVSYSHFFYNQMSGRPYGGFSMDTRLKNIGFSFVQGHQQMYITGTRSLNNGKRIRGLVCGNCYLHDEDYRGPQANSEWRGIFILHEVSDGDYSLLEVSLDFLCRRYEGVSVADFLLAKYPELYYNSHWNSL